jgi:HSP20 family protein
MNTLPARLRSFPSFFSTDLDDYMKGLFGNGSKRSGLENPEPVLQPLLNVAETDKAWMVSVELPGLEDKDINVQVMGSQLMISGEKQWEKEKKLKNFHRVECQYGWFERTITVPNNVRLDAESISAKFKNGVLEVTLQKLEPTPSAKIKVMGS